MKIERSDRSDRSKCGSVKLSKIWDLTDPNVELSDPNVEKMTFTSNTTKRYWFIHIWITQFHICSEISDLWKIWDLSTFVAHPNVDDLKSLLIFTDISRSRSFLVSNSCISQKTAGITRVSFSSFTEDASVPFEVSQLIMTLARKRSFGDFVTNSWLATTTWVRSPV